MASDLTGDFDVVAEFALPAANRVLAAMHRLERMLHTMSVRVDDNPPPGHHPKDPTIVASVDLFGDASANHDRIPRFPRPGGHALSSAHFPGLDSIVNSDLAGVNIEPVQPSHLKGRAQLQLSPPTIHVPDTSGRKVTVKMQLRARYFADPPTPRVAEFVRGELQITAGINEVASQVARVVEIDIKGNTVQTQFVPAWTSTPVSAEDMAGVNQLLQNSLRTSFLPTNATLPENIAHIQFKTMRGGQDALAVLLDMSGAAGNPASQTNVFLGSGDDFALAAGADFVHKQFEPTLEKIRSQQIAPVSFTISSIVQTWHITYTFKINSVTLELTNGSMVLTIEGHAHTGSRTPDFDFTIKQVLTLKVVGSTAELEVGDLSVETSSWVIDRFKGTFTSRISAIRDRALAQSDAQTTVRKALDADDKLGGLLDSLLRPQRPSPGPPPKGYSLAYTSAEIRTSGIVLHGSMAVPDWPAPHVEFERIPPTNGSAPPGGTHGIRDGPTYSALKSWIPGGTIQRHEWSKPGETQPFLVDENKFIYAEVAPGLILDDEGTAPSVPATPIVSDETRPTHAILGYMPLCLTVKGSRLSVSGPVTPQPVSQTICGFGAFPVLEALALAREGEVPMVALTHAGPNGLVELIGHARPATAPSGGAAPNLLVHFVDERTAANLDILMQALRESGRHDAATGVLAVLDKDQLSRIRYTPGVVYAEQNGGRWENALRLKDVRRPVTFILGPKREVLWKKEGEIDKAALTDALRQYLLKSGEIRIGMLGSSVRIGHPPPNLLLEHAPGRQITLRKLAGRPVTLIFWKGSSKPSINAVRALQTVGGNDQSKAPVILAVNDGETAEAARAAAAANHIVATVVADPKRRISEAYGVKIWPTIVSVDASGLVSGVNYGLETRTTVTPE